MCPIKFAIKILSRIFRHFVERISYTRLLLLQRALRKREITAVRLAASNDNTMLATKLRNIQRNFHFITLSVLCDKDTNYV